MQSEGIMRPSVRLSALLERESARTLFEVLGRELAMRASLSEPIVLQLRVAVRLDSARTSATRIVVDSAGRFFEPPGSARVDLRRSPVLRSLLLALLRAHRDQPSRACSREALVAACWPDVRLAPASLGNRLRVAIAMLRRRGLRHVLRGDADGWWLDAGVSFEIVGH